MPAPPLFRIAVRHRVDLGGANPYNSACIMATFRSRFSSGAHARPVPDSDSRELRVEPVAESDHGASQHCQKSEFNLPNLQPAGV